MKDRYLEPKTLIAAMFLFTVVLWGCQKGDQTLGIGLLPGVSVLETRYHPDTEDINAFTVTDKRIRVDKPKYNLLGSINDHVFGRTDASFAAQYRIPKFHPGFKPSAQLDSVILRMTYKKIYGDTITPQNIKVYELTGNLDYNAQYYSTWNLKNIVSAEPIGAGSFPPFFRTDSTLRDTTVQVIRVPLSTAFGNRLLQIDSTKMINNDSLLTVFKGLYISSMPVDRRGTIVSVEASAVTLYYHDPVLKKDTLVFDFVMTENAARVSDYNHVYSLARFFPNLDKPYNTDTLVYVQATGGIKTKIMVPSLSLWKDSSNYLINKAMLTFHVDTIMSDYRRFAMPDRLYLKVITGNDEETFPTDSKYSYYDGVFNYSKATYSFNLTQHLQELIKELNSPEPKLENKGFYLVHSDRNNSPSRVVLKGPDSSKPVELNITYTLYK